MSRTIKLTGRTADEIEPVPTRPPCVACGHPGTGVWLVLMEDGWRCQDCLTDDQRRIWLKVFGDAKE